MQLSKEFVRNRCVDALSTAGVSPELCQFYADVVQCEYDVTHTVYRMWQDVQEVRQDPRNIDLVASTIQSISKSFIVWKRQLEQLTTRRLSVSSMQLSEKNIETIRAALCSLHTKQVQLKQGENIVITDVSKPNKLKVRTERGQEGYVPALSCLLPSPDTSPIDALDRLQLYLLMCWADCDNKLKLCLRDSLGVATARLCNFWSNCKHDDGRWSERITRRLSRLIDTTRSELNNGLDCNRLHKTLASVENELLWRRNIELSTMVEVAASLDKAILLYQSFYRHWRLFRQQVRESPVRPLRLVLQWDPRLMSDPNKTFRYYEVKLTAEETTVREETVKVATASDKVKDDLNGHQVKDTAGLPATDDTDRAAYDATDKTVTHPPTAPPAAAAAEHETKTTFGEESSWSKITVQNQEETSRGPDDEVFTDATSADEDAGLSRKDVLDSNAAAAAAAGDEDRTRYSESTEHVAFGFESRSTVDYGQAAGSGGSGSESVTEESWRQLSGSAEEEAAGKLTSSSASVDDQPTMLIGGTNRQSIDAEQVTVASHEENCRFVVRSVLDPRDGQRISIKEAVSAGIVDRLGGIYVNPTTGVTCPIAAAMQDGRIHVEHVRTTRTPETIQSIGLITIRTQTVTNEFVVTGAMDVAAGATLDVNQAKQRGILDETAGVFINTSTGQQLAIDDAVEAGFVLAQFDDTLPPGSPPPCSVKTYAVSAVVDQLRRRAVPFSDAVRRGLVDRETGCYINNATGERVFAGDAVRRGFYKCSAVTDPNSLIGIDSSNNVVVDRIDRVRKNVLREVQVVSAFKQSLGNR